MMELVKTVSFDKYLSYRSTGVVTRAVDKMYDRAKWLEGVEWGGKQASKEAVINAVLYWASGLPDSDLERILSEHLRKLEAQMGGQDESPVSEPAASSPRESEDSPGPAKHVGTVELPLKRSPRPKRRSR